MATAAAGAKALKHPLDIGSPQHAPSHFLCRQPIVERNLHVYGHELLYRAQPSCEGFSGDGDEATRQVVDTYLLLTPDEDPTYAFINCTRQSLLGQIVTLLPTEHTVLEILETVIPDQEVRESCVALKEAGFRFALDDFSPDPTMAPLIELADYVKIDFQASDAAARREIYSMCRGAKLRLLAEKVETAEQMEIAHNEGCTLFQGYFFARPSIAAKATIPQLKMNYVRLLSALAKEPIQFRELEVLVAAEPSLCYRLLRLVNSALYGNRAPVTSIGSALMIVGETEFRKLLSAAIAGSFVNEGSLKLVTLALERARFCELLAADTDLPSSGLYLAGMFSLMDVMLQVSPQHLVDALHLTGDLRAALLHQPGPMGQMLDLVRAYEAGDWEGCEAHMQGLGLKEESVSRKYLESVRWTRTVMEPT